LFCVFDSNGDGYLDITEFATNMFKLYASEFSIKMKVIFDLYFESIKYIAMISIRMVPLPKRMLVFCFLMLLLLNPHNTKAS
jgi:hypothetical protein